MSKKDYDFVASVMRMTKPVAIAIPGHAIEKERNQWERIRDEFAYRFEVNSSKFDRERFYEACE